MTGRAYNTFTTGINGVSAITGSNIMDIASIGIDLGLSTANTALLTDAYNRVHAEITVKNGIKADGIRADGSFGKCIGHSSKNMFLLKLIQDNTQESFITEIMVSTYQYFVICAQL